MRVATGWPWGRHSRPAFLNSPTSSFFLVSTLITGSAVSWWALTCSLMYRNCASRSGCRWPSMVLALPCRLNPSARSRSPTVSAPTRWPWRVSSAARLRVDFVVHRSGDIGSPRSSGSTRASSAGPSPGSISAARLRPPPGRRTRPSGSAPESSSLTPRDTVASRTPAARATSRIPPCPSARASAPISSRRCRSSRCGKIAANFAARTRTASSLPPIPHQHAASQEATGYFSASPNSSLLGLVSVFWSARAACNRARLRSLQAVCVSACSAPSRRLRASKV